VIIPNSPQLPCPCARLDRKGRFLICAEPNSSSRGESLEGVLPLSVEFYCAKRLELYKAIVTAPLRSGEFLVKGSGQLGAHQSHDVSQKHAFPAALPSYQVGAKEFLFMIARRRGVHQTEMIEPWGVPALLRSVAMIW
jgi:hypothetical protein